MRISDWSSDVCSSVLIALESDLRVFREGASEDGDDFLGGEEAVAAVAGALAQNAGSGEGIERTGRGLERDVQFRCQHLGRSEEHTSELQSLMRISYAVFCLKKKKKQRHTL